MKKIIKTWECVEENEDGFVAILKFGTFSDIGAARAVASAMHKTIKEDLMKSGASPHTAEIFPLGPKP